MNRVRPGIGQILASPFAAFADVFRIRPVFRIYVILLAIWAGGRVCGSVINLAAPDFTQWLSKPKEDPQAMLVVAAIVLVLFLLSIPAVVSLLRYFGARDIHPYSFRRPFLRFTGMGFLVFLGLMLIPLAGILCIALVFGGMKKDAWQPIVAIAAIGVFTLWLTARMSPVWAALALDEPDPITRSFSATRGSGFAIAIALVLQALLPWPIVVGLFYAYVLLLGFVYPLTFGPVALLQLGDAGFAIALELIAILMWLPLGFAIIFEFAYNSAFYGRLYRLVHTSRSSPAEPAVSNYSAAWSQSST